MRHGGDVVLLKSIVHDVARLSRHGVVYSKNARAVRDGLDDGLQTLLKLLSIEACARADGRLVLGPNRRHGPAKVHATKLMGGSLDVEQLLLESSLLLCEIRVGGEKLVVQILIHVFASFSIDLNRWRREDVLGKRVHLPTSDVVAAWCMAWEIGTRCGLGNPLLSLRISILAAL
jgi:hypothetical protein